MFSFFGIGKREKKRGGYETNLISQWQLKHVSALESGTTTIKKNKWRKKMGDRGKDRQRNRCRTDRYEEGGKEKNEFNVQSKWSEIWFTKRRSRRKRKEKNAAQARRYFSTFSVSFCVFLFSSYPPSLCKWYSTRISCARYLRTKDADRLCVYLGSLRQRNPVLTGSPA